jgi:hypothetical protein
MSASGQQIDNWVPVLSGLKCRLETKSGGRTIGPVAVYEAASHILFLAPTKIVLDIHNHRIDISGTKYRIMLIMPGKNSSVVHHQELLLEKVT